MQITSNNSEEFLKVRGYTYKTINSIVELEQELEELGEKRTLQSRIKTRHIKTRIKELTDEKRT